MLTTERHSPTTVPNTAVELAPGPEWASFEQFRTGGVAALESIKPGQAGTLRTKAGSYRILNERDFQNLIGLASEVERLRNGFTTIVHAVRVVKENPQSSSAVELLVHVATQCSTSPVLPTRVGHAELAPEPAEVPEDDELILDPARLRESAGQR